MRLGLHWYERRKQRGEDWAKEQGLKPGRETDVGRRRQFPQVQQAKITSREPDCRGQKPQSRAWKAEAQRLRKGAAEALGGNPSR